MLLEEITNMPVEDNINIELTNEDKEKLSALRNAHNAFTDKRMLRELQRATGIYIVPIEKKDPKVDYTHHEIEYLSIIYAKTMGSVIKEQPVGRV